MAGLQACRCCGRWREEGQVCVVQLIKVAPHLLVLV